MTVTVTSNIQSQIDEYKKFLEKEHVFTYAYEKDSHLYYYVGYTRFNKLSGLVILSETDQDPVRLRHAAESIFQFNRVVIESSSELIANINRPIEEVQQAQRLLQQARNTPSLQMQALEPHIQSVQQGLDIVIDAIPELQNTFKSIQSLERKVLDEGIVRDEDVAAMIDYNLHHYAVMYHQGQVQLSIMPDLNRIKQHLADRKGTLAGQDEQLRQQLYTLTDAMTLEQNVQTLRTSQAKFEYDGQGRPISLSTGEDGVRQMIAYHREYMKYKFDTEIIKDFRNL